MSFSVLCLLHTCSEYEQFISFVFSFYTPSLYPSLCSPHFLELQNCRSAVGSQLRLSTPNSLIKNCVSGPIQALKAPLNGFSFRVPSLKTTQTHTLHCSDFKPYHGNDLTAESFLFLRFISTYRYLPFFLSLLYSCLFTTALNTLLMDN